MQFRFPGFHHGFLGTSAHEALLRHASGIEFFSHVQEGFVSRLIVPFENVGTRRELPPFSESTRLGGSENGLCANVSLAFVRGGTENCDHLFRSIVSFGMQLVILMRSRGVSEAWNIYPRWGLLS